MSTYMSQAYLERTETPETTDTFAATLRAWGLNPVEVMDSADRKTAQTAAPSANEILHQWGEAPLPDTDVEASAVAEVDAAYGDYYAEACRQLKEVLPWWRGRKLRREATRIADIAFQGGEYPNELGFRTGPAPASERISPAGQKLVTKGRNILHQWTAAAACYGPIAVAQYYASQAYNRLHQLSEEGKMTVFSLGVVAAAATAKVVILDPINDSLQEFEATIGAALAK